MLQPLLNSYFSSLQGQKNCKPQKDSSGASRRYYPSGALHTLAERGRSPAPLFFDWDGSRIKNMKKPLLVESPTKCKTIQAILVSEWQVEASFSQVL